MLLKGKAKKAQEKLGWKNDVSIDDLIQEMVDGDMDYFAGRSKK